MSQSILQPGSALDKEQASQDMVAKVPQEAETIESRISSLKLDFSKGDQVLYAFDPINTETQIRILVLEPPAPSNPNALHGTLVTATLADRPLYEALSYTWGDPVFPELISFPSGFLPITANLASALRRLRFPDRPRGHSRPADECARRCACRHCWECQPLR